MGVSRLATIRNVTISCLDDMTDADLSNPEYVEHTILNQVASTIELQNAVRPKSSKWRIPDALMPAQIALILARTYNICRVITGGDGSDSEYDLLALYQTEGENEGIYVTDDESLRRLMREYNFGMSLLECKECASCLRDIVPRRERTSAPNLVAVGNGIFDFDTKVLSPFTPDQVFLSKSRVNYNDQAKNVVIHNPDDNTDWDVESWMAELSDDPDVVNLLWEILSAVVRPHVSWGKAAWFYSETGNNGKGTLCALMRNLIGSGSYASITLSEMGKDFALEPLVRSTAVIVDENDVGTFIDKAANLKAIVTHDVISINRKFKTPIAYQFYGFMVQCLNEFPRVKDKTDSFARRQLFVPFTKCFTGHERKYIKDDYLKRREVLEYVLYRVLNMNHYVLSTPDVCKNVLDEYRAFNDPVRQFVEEIFPELSWDLLPYNFLYDLYVAWFRQNNRSGTVQGKNTFVKDLRGCLDQNPDWDCMERGKLAKSAGRMDRPEHLILQYNLDAWKNDYYRGSDPDKICRTPLKDTYFGVLRRA